MIHHVWRLSENGEDNLGLSVSGDGLILGRTPLIERRNERFSVRDRGEIERLLSRAYSVEVVVDGLMPGLGTVASALNANEPCLARIAAVHLRIPDLPDQAARGSMEAEDILIKSADWKPALHPRGIHKASPDDPKHPGWPAGTPGGLGGKFRPKDGSDAAMQEVARAMARDALRTGALAVLRIAVESLAEAVPGIDLAATTAMLVEMANLISQFKKLKIDADAAIDFAANGPYTLEELQVPSSTYEEFSSYEAFYKDETRADCLAKRFGRAGDGSQYHHIVTQGGTNADNITPQQLQNTDNIVILPTLLHEAVNAEYMRPAPKDRSMTLYQWLQTQPYDVQRDEGLKILRRLYILK